MLKRASVCGVLLERISECLKSEHRIRYHEKVKEQEADNDCETVGTVMCAIPAQRYSDSVSKE